MELGAITYFFTIFSLLMGFNSTEAESPSIAVAPGTAAVAETDDGSEIMQIAKCLTEKDAKLYGSYWCSHCKSQKEMFGGHLSLIQYIECDDKGPNGDSSVCREAEIEAYPTWKSPNLPTLQGVQSLKKLSAWSGCTYLSE